MSERLPKQEKNKKLFGAAKVYENINLLKDPETKIRIIKLIVGATTGFIPSNELISKTDSKLTQEILENFYSRYTTMKNTKDANGVENFGIEEKLKEIVNQIIDTEKKEKPGEEVFEQEEYRTALEKFLEITKETYKL
ncbi:MAG: hypothetical protein AAB693_02925 [Patescibacteria group bacterium]